MSRLAALPLCVLLAAAPVRADDDPPAPNARHTLELAVGGGPSWWSVDPERFDFGLGGQLAARARLDVGFVRAEGLALMPDPSRPDHLHVAGTARILFATVHDFTWRRTDVSDLMRLMAGVGGDVELPDGIGAVEMSAGFAMLHVSPAPDGQPLSEAYGAYAGLALRLRFWEIRDELRVAAHALMPPPDGFDFALLEDPFAAFVGGFTASNRLYVQALREGVISLGPELFVQYEQLLEGPVLFATLGLSGTLGI